MESQPPVVAGVDGSDESMAAAEWAAREAVRRERPLRLVHVWEHRPAHPDAARRYLERRVLSRAGQRVRAMCPELTLQDEMLTGPVTTALVAAAARAELLVLGSRGLSGLAGFLVGSVSLGAVAHAERPVVLVRAGEDAADEHFPDDDGGPSVYTGYRDVVLAIDVADVCDEVIGFAFEAARLRGARLRAVHAWQPPGPLEHGSGVVRRPERAEERLDFLRAVLQTWHDKYPEVTVEETVVEDRPTTPLVRASTGAGLLVVGHHLTARTGSVTHAAICHAGCPVAVVPHR